jgi:hypothetical protein
MNYSLAKFLGAGVFVILLLTPVPVQGAGRGNSSYA